jgi:H+/Cl- antiporter ClcA
MFAVLGVVAIGYPQVLGNGKAMVQLGVLGRFSLGLFAILLILKPLMTGGTLSSGVPGGLFTPTLAIGTMFGGLAGGLWLHLWPGGDVGAYALIGGAAMLGAAMQGPLSAIVMVLELMPRAAGLTVPILIAVATATVVARIAGAHSLYSVRLAQRWTDEGRPEPPRKAIPG